MAKSWEQTVWRAWRSRAVTTAERRDVLLSLAAYGRAPYPSHETLADRARVSVRTVQRALEEARDVGLLDWTERRVKRGWRWLRTSNVYRLLVPATTGQEACGGNRVNIKKALGGVDNRRPRLRPVAPVRSVEEQLTILRTGCAAGASS